MDKINSTFLERKYGVFQRMLDYFDGKLGISSGNSFILGKLITCLDLTFEV